MDEVIENADDLYNTREIIIDILEGKEKSEDGQMFKEKIKDKSNFDWTFKKKMLKQNWKVLY